MEDSDSDTPMVDLNPKIRVGQIRWKKVRDQKIANALSRLQHACECLNSECPNVDCDEMKSLVVHCKICTLKPKKNCRPCKQLLSLCIYHARRNKDCISLKCSVPYCAKIKHTIMLKKKVFRKTLKELYREGCVSKKIGGCEFFFDMPSTSSVGQMEEQRPETIVVDDDEESDDGEAAQSQPRDLSNAYQEIPEHEPLPTIEIDDDELSSISNFSNVQQAAELDSPLSPEPEGMEDSFSEDVSESNHPTSSQVNQRENPVIIPLIRTESYQPDPYRQCTLPANSDLEYAPNQRPLGLRLNHLMTSWKCPPPENSWTSTDFTNDNPQPQPSTSNTFVPPAGDELHHLKKLLHAHKCLTNESRGAVGGWPCFESNCGFWKNLLKHIQDCLYENCPMPYCDSSKFLLKHWQTCQMCPFCSSIRRCSTIMQGLTLQGSSFNLRYPPGNSFRLARKRVLVEMSTVQRNSQPEGGHRANFVPHSFGPRAQYESPEGTSSSTSSVQILREQN